MADTSRFTTEECPFVIARVEEKEQTSETCKDIRLIFFYHFNKQTLTKANVRKVEENIFITGSVLNSERSEIPTKYVDDEVSDHLNAPLRHSPTKPTRKRLTEIKMQRTSMRYWMRKAGYNAYIYPAL